MYRDIRYRVMSVCGIVLFATISTNHRATGFSSFRPIDSLSDSILRSKIGYRSSLWCVVEKTQEDCKPAFSQTENVVGVGTIGPPSNGVPFRRRRKISAAASENFERRFLELLAFKESHGHTRVPRRQGKLGDWVNKLRQRKDRLDEQRLGRLNEIGFCWDASDDKLRKEKERWWERLESLRIHQGQIQSSVLLHDGLTNSEKKWLRRQQLQYFDSDRKPSLRLDKSQIQALKSIDPNWWQTARERNWDIQYSALKDFRSRHGHTKVTSTYKDKKLFNWVQNTRKMYKAIKLQHEEGFRRDGSPKLSEAQIELLDDIDFNWDPWKHYDDGNWPLIDYTS